MDLLLGNDARQQIVVGDIAFDQRDPVVELSW